MSRHSADATVSGSRGAFAGIAPAWWHLAALVVLAVLVRWIAWSNTVMMFNDGPDFLWQARMILDGRWLDSLHHQYHPLYSLAVAGLFQLVRDLETAGAWTSILSGGVLVAGVFGVARVLFPDRYAVALVTGLLAAIHTRAVRYGADIQSDGLMLAMVAMACWTGLRGVSSRGGLGWMTASGAFVGLAFLTRPEALILTVPLGLWALAGLRSEGQLALRVRSGLAFSVGLVFVLTPFVFAIHELTGGWGLSLHSQLRAFGLTPPGVELGFHPESPMASPHLGRHVSLVAGEGLSWGAAIASAVDHLVDGLRIDMVVFGSAGGWLLWRSGRRGLLGVLGSLLLLFFLGTVHSMHLGWFGSGRYYAILLLALFPVAALGWLRAWGMASGRAGMAVRGLLVVVLVFVVAKSVSPRRERLAARLQALEWVRERSEIDEAIVGESRRDGFYSQRPLILARFPWDEQQLLSLIRAHRGGYLLYELEDLEEHAPHWLEEEAPVREVVRFEQDGAKTVVLLRPVDGGPSS
jgi:hypothetical protein